MGRKDDMMTVGDLVAKLGAKLDGFNLLEVVTYLRESKLARKVRIEIRPFRLEHLRYISCRRYLAIAIKYWSKSLPKVLI